MKATLPSIFFFIFLINLIKINGEKSHVINFRSRSLYPESVTWDPRSQHFIAGGTGKAKLVSVSDAGVVETLVSEKDIPVDSGFRGLAVDRVNNRLLACIHRPPSPGSTSPEPFNALAAYDLKSHRRLFLTPFLDNPDVIRSVTDVVSTGESKHSVASDVAVDFSGNAYVTDSGRDVIWKVDKNGDVSVLSESKAFKSYHPVDATIDDHYQKIGLNGIVYSSKGYLLVIQSNTGKLFKVDVDDGSARAVTLNKDLTAPCGIAVRKDGVVLVVSQHTLYFVTSNDGWGEAVVFDETTLDAERFPTGVTVGDQNRVYVLYGHVNEGSLGNADREEFSVVEVESEEENKEDNVWLYALIGLGLAYFLFWRFQMRRLVENMNKKVA